MGKAEYQQTNQIAKKETKFNQFTSNGFNVKKTRIPDWNNVSVMSTKSIKFHLSIKYII